MLTREKMGKKQGQQEDGREKREKTTHRLNRTLSLVLLEVREAHDLTANEVLLEVGAEERAKSGQNEGKEGKEGRRDELDNTSGGRRLGALTDGPRTDFLRSAGEVVDELRKGGGQCQGNREEGDRRTDVEGTVTDLHDLADLRVGADLGKLLSETSGVVGVLDGETLLEGNREGNEQVSGVVLVDPRLDLGEPGKNAELAVVEEE
jgi:hypothetical protein